MTNSATTTLSENLKALRAATPLLSSQAAIGKAAKIDQRTVGRILNEENAPTLDQLTKIAKAFNLEPWQLLVPRLEPTNPPMLASKSAGLRRLLANIGQTKEALEGFLQQEGNTRPGELD